MSRGRGNFDAQFDLKVDTFGGWAKIAEGERDLFLRSLHKSLKEEGDKVKLAGRGEIRKAKIRGAARLATALRGEIFPKRADARARNPAYVLGTNAAMPLDHLDTGITITAKGEGLMVPIGEAAKFKQPNFVERSGRLARTILAMKQKYGDLKWHKLRDGRMALGAWVEGRSFQQRFKPLFIVVKSVTIPKKLDLKATIERASQGYEQRVADRTMDLFMAGHDAVVARAMGSRGR